MLTKEKLLAAVATRTEDVHVAGLDDVVRIKVMSGYDRDAFQKVVQTQGLTDSVYFSALVAATVVTEGGEPMFCAEEVDLLRQGHAELIRQIGLECQRVNGLGQKAVDAEEKNSEAIQSNSSGTD
ncbi:hypothetical protein [Burkholderia gladioli]|uniref:hypothetical protein n=1 Tax=Burkholderia gladioli TaxID=28095 RepID=UPI0016408D61|nr:hypothetical protein [Burkholderia gladioli]